MLNILIVEDDVTIRELLNYNLKKKFKILEANSAEEAIDVCDNNNIHLILLDWMLPEMSGLSFLRTLKKQKSKSGIPIIFVTAREDEKDKIVGLNSGADDYITKPFSHLELLARVEAVLKRAKHGDFRVQDDFGGSVEPYVPTKDQIVFAENILQKIPFNCLYARVDVVLDNNNQLALSELELIEPEMWFRYNREAAVKLAEGIKSYF